MRSLLIILITGFLSIQSMAQDGVHADSSVLQLRSFDSAKMAAYRRDIDFQYDRDRSPSKSLWQRFVEWFWETVEELLNTKGGQATYKILLIVLSVAILTYVILRLSGMTRMGMFTRADGDLGLDYTVGQEDIHSLNFDEAIANAESSRNFRLGIRLLYLQTLKKLSERQLIQWRLNKTNTVYAQELAESGHAKPFRELTRDFEYAWYGERHVAEQDFNNLKEQFKQFNRQL